MNAYNKIVLNIPHSNICNYSTGWTGAINMFPTVKNLTDWHTDVMFADNNERVDSVIFPYSRFYIDAERLVNDPMEEIGQGILYTKIDGFYRNLECMDKNSMLSIYNDYHKVLNDKCTGDTMVIDCHSFNSELSDVDICLGFNDDESKADDKLINIIKETFESAGYKVGINTPYSNSIRPDNCKSTLMIELNKKIYMNENTLELLHGDSIRVKRLISNIYNKILYYE